MSNVTRWVPLGGYPQVIGRTSDHDVLRTGHRCFVRHVGPHDLMPYPCVIVQLFHHYFRLTSRQMKKLVSVLCLEVSVLALISQLSLITVKCPADHMPNHSASRYSCITHDRGTIVNTKEVV